MEPGQPSDSRKDLDPHFPNSFTPDGLLVYEESTAPPRDLGVVNVNGDRNGDLLLHEPYNEGNAALSPDGRWLASVERMRQNEIVRAPRSPR